MQGGTPVTKLGGAMTSSAEVPTPDTIHRWNHFQMTRIPVRLPPNNVCMVDRSEAASANPLAVRVRGLRYRYPGATTDAMILPELDLAEGEQMLLTAASGAGKSTLLHLLAGLIDPTAGTVEIAGTDIHALRGAARDRFRGRHVGMIFQTFHLLHGFTAAENVMAALMFSDVPPREHADRARSLLAHLGIERSDAMPETLSVGQQQRVAVARAVATSPNIVLADEPTASLDPEAGARAMHLIQTACAEVGAALLCVSHDPAMPARFTRHEHLPAAADEPSTIGA